MLRKLRGKGNKQAPSLLFAAFGKHPGWNDHIPDLGVETDGLIAAKRVLYVEGIGGNIDSGSWEELEPDRCLPSFHHVFSWKQDDEWILGRLWSSTDGKGRSRYPMIVCAAGRGLDFRASGPRVFERLGEIEASCKMTESADEVSSILSQARKELTAATVNTAPRDDHDEASNPLATLADRDEMGDDGLGLTRLLYHMDRENSEYHRLETGKDRSSTTTRIRTGRASHMRVPRCAEHAFDAVALWGDFLHHKFVDSVPRWVICPLDEEWVDLLVGPVSKSQFFCMRVPPSELPLTTDIPYQIEEEFAERVRQSYRASGTDPANNG